MQEVHTFEIKPRKAFAFNFKELAAHSELLYFFAWRDIKIKYKQTVLGFLWAVLQPLLLMLIFTVFIGRALQVSSEGMEYPVFVYSGLVLWLVFASGVTTAANSMVSNAAIIKKIYFPRLIIPISAVLVALFDFVMAFAIFIVILFFFSTPVDLLRLLYSWPLAILLTIVATAGPGCLLAALNIKYRDFRYVVPFLIQILLFVTPVIYPVSAISQNWLKYVVALNPMYAAISVFRMPLAEAPPDWILLIISVVSGVVLFLIGLAYFRRTENYFADIA
ncbi:MAG: ABC transporter permease [Cyclobacteriaceae bacterium]|nr:ABC transporter permease [Cyclobacteriaceae bacterium]